MTVVFVQTADPDRYYAMLIETAKTVREYCRRKGYDYESYIGLKRGYKPWHATWNRVYIFKELMDRGRHDWVVYLDADAYIADLDFDFESYLAPLANKAAVMTPSGASPNWWDINAGVMLLNLRHPATQSLISSWVEAYERIHSDESLRESTGWSTPDDQEVVMDYMRNNEPALRDQVHLESNEYLNSLGARFIRQILRDFVPTFQARMAAISRAVALVMGGAEAQPGLAPRQSAPVAAVGSDEQIARFIDDTYFALLGRHADPQAIASNSGMIRELGPYSGSAMLVRVLLRTSEFADRFPVIPSDGYTLTALADQAGNAKGVRHSSAHAYSLIYDLLLQPRRASVKRMLEIGLSVEGPEVGLPVDHRPSSTPSVGLWLQLFPYAEVHGFDILDCSHLKAHRFHFTRGDAGVEADLRRAVVGEGSFDLVVDDGSHASFHQQLALKVIFPRLSPGGLYVIESLHWQPPAYENTVPRTMKTADLIQHWFDTGRFPEIATPELAGLEEIAEQIAFAFVFNQPFAAGDPTPKMAVLQKKF
jgi:hypothetical protein